MIFLELKPKVKVTLTGKQYVTAPRYIHKPDLGIMPQIVCSGHNFLELRSNQGHSDPEIVLA